MATLLGSLLVELGLESGTFKSGLTAAQKELERTKRQFQKIGESIKQFGTGLSVGITAPLLGVAAASISATKQLAQDAETMQRAAKAAGAGFEEFQRAASAAYVGAGIESEKFSDILKDTQDKIGDFAATGGGELKDFFEKVAAPQGLTVNDFIGKSSIEQLRMFVAALETAGVPQEQMIFYLESIADEGSALLPILTANGAALDQLGQKAAIIDPAAAAKLKEYTAAQRELDAALRNLTVALVNSGLIDAMAKVVTTVAEWAGSFAKASPELFKFTAIAAGIAAAVGPVLVALGSLVTIAPALASAFGVIKVAALGLMANPAILGFAAVVGGIYLAWTNWDKITAIVSRMYNGVRTWLVDKLGAVFNWLRDKIRAVTGFFFDMYDAVVGHSYVPDMVDEIGQHMNRLQGLMVDPARKATESVTEATRQMAADISALLDRLFPEIAKARKMAEELALLDRAGLSDGALGKARMRRLGEEYGGEAVMSDWLKNGTDPLLKAANDAGKAIEGLGDRSETQTVRIAQTFDDMARSAISSLQQLAGAVKGGGFLDILSSIVGIGLQLGQMGAFGKSLQGRLSQPIPGYANGTNFARGGLSLVGERGPELVNLPRGAGVMTNKELRGLGGGGIAQIVPSPYFDVVVDGRVMQAAPAVAAAGAMQAQGMAARTARRSVRG